VSEATVITSGDILEDIEHSFRVFAGPGAGKTRWLVSHIKNVIARSERLLPTTKIVCISYTNVAANQIMRGLGPAAEACEISTIHSFLYRFVVKPYLHTLTDENEEPIVDFARVDGHDDYRLIAYPCLMEWIDSIPKSGLIKTKEKKSDLSDLCVYLSRCSWQLSEEDGTWSFRRRPEDTGWPSIWKIFRDNLDTYKRSYWRLGIIHHDDVLYFAHRILTENPELTGFLAARFPYVFVDEFQDTNPVQTEVVKWLAKQGVVVGVIGDTEQSIYSFQGAKMEHFLQFDVPGLVDYCIEGNWRSTNSIVQILNKVRAGSLQQVGIHDITGAPVCLCIGDRTTVAQCVRRRFGDTTNTTAGSPALAVLAKKNNEVNAIRIGTKHKKVSIWEELEGVDGYRGWLLEHVAKGCVLAAQTDYPGAVLAIKKGIRVSRKGLVKEPFKPEMHLSEFQVSSLAVSVLGHIMPRYDALQSASVLEVYRDLSQSISETIPGLSLTSVTATGSFGKLASSTAFRDLIESLNMTEECREVRTIHKAKSAEFNSVLVCLDDESALQCVGQSEASASDEDRRILYVALSRAMNHLVVTVPSVSEDNKKLLSDTGLEIRHCNDCKESVSGF
jgi:DNA helicase-2/ATP-dependent DNA helicase PcrA